MQRVIPSTGSVSVPSRSKRMSNDRESSRSGWSIHSEPAQADALVVDHVPEVALGIRGEALGLGVDAQVLDPLGLDAAPARRGFGQGEPVQAGVGPLPLGMILQDRALFGSAVQAAGDD